MKIRRIPLYILSAANLGTVLALLATGYASHLNPNTYGWLSVMGYAFPVMLLLTLAFLVLWLFIRKRYALISIAGLLAAYHPVTLFCPINTTQEVPQDAFTVISYNTHYWGKGEKKDHEDDWDTMGCDEHGNNVCISYLAGQGADVLCLQESGNFFNVQKDLDDRLFPIYQHRDSVHGNGGSIVWTFSKHPITRKQLIPIDTKGNIVAAFWVSIRDKEIIFVNCHLQTTGLSVEDRQKFSSMMHGYQETDTMRSTSRTVFGKLLESSKQRTSQAEQIAAFVRQHADTPVIVCGDFNDIPHSYVHHVIADGMTDCYQQTAFGPGFSFSHYGMRVRIDNMLCSPTLTPYNCEVDNTIDVSDHYPVKCAFN